MILNGMEIKLQDGMAFALYSTGPLLDSVHDFRTQPGFFRNKVLLRTIFIWRAKLELAILLGSNQLASFHPL